MLDQDRENIVMKKKVVIIGAGPAGLTAGYELMKQSDEYEVIILEASESIGGISRTVKYNGNRMDIGGHRFFSKDKQVTKWWENIMPLQGKPAYDDKCLCRTKNIAKQGPDPEKEDRVMLLRQRVSRIFYNKKFFDYPISMKMQTIKNMGFFTTIFAGFSYLKSCIVKKNESSLENFYINRFGKVLYGMFFEGYTEKLWGRHPSKISADWGAQRVKGLSIIAIIKDMFSKLIPSKKGRQVETSLIEEFVYPKFGPGQLWEITAQEFESMGGKLYKNSEVIKINVAEGKLKSVTYFKDGKNEDLEADFFISSMPVRDLVLAWEGEEVPKNVNRVAAGLPYRDFVTVGVLVDKMKIKNMTEMKTLNNIVPDCWIYVQDTSVKLGRIQIFNNWSPYMVKDINKTVWIGLEYFCDEGDEFWNMSEEDCAKMAIHELVKIGVIDKKDVLDFHIERVEKAYPAYFDTYKELDVVIDFLNEHDNLFCVGRNGQHRYNNMDHSMVTSFESVKNIINGVKTKDNIWNVNTDAEYHEESK